MITYDLLVRDGGLIQQQFPKEFDYQGKGTEGEFLANLCLYLLTPQVEEPNLAFFFKEEDKRLFLKHFVFHNIPENTFRSGMAEEKTDEDKVTLIFSLIKNNIMTKAGNYPPFYTFYRRGFKSFVESNATEDQKILYCKNLRNLYQANDYPDDWIPPVTWQSFTKDCQKHGIHLAQKTSKDKEHLPQGGALGELRDILTTYLQERTDKRDTKTKITKEYLHSTLFKVFQKSYTEKKGAVEALQDALDGKKTDLNKHLATLRDGNLGKNLRAFIKAGKANQIVGGQEVNTVTDFVHALHSQVNKLENTPK